MTETKDSNGKTGSGFAAATCSPARYVISHVSDLEKVPADRLEACLRELKDFVETARAARELVTALAELTGASSAMKIGDFTWIDDGKNEKTITFSAMENSVLCETVAKTSNEKTLD
jgi:hypothetical protein